MSAPGLKLCIETGTAPGAGAIVFRNSGDVTARIWSPANRWGDTALSFELSRREQRVAISLAPQVYTRNVPSSVSLLPGGEHRWPFDLGDGRWESATEDWQSLAGPDARLAALYRADSCPEAIEHGLWLGQLRSDPVAWFR